MTLFNFHIGLPNVGANVIHAVETANLVNVSRYRHIVSTERYREVFRGLVNDDRVDGQSDRGALKEVFSVLHTLSEYQLVAFCQQAFMGTPEEIISSARGFKRAAARVARLSELFLDHELTIHLTICNPIDFFLEALGPRANSIALSTEVPSWSVLVAKIRDAAPGRKIIVWDFRKPDAIVLSFVSMMLNLENEELTDEIRALVRRKIAKKSNSSDLIPLYEFMGYTYERYIDDLAVIDKLNDVSLIDKDSIPPDLHL
jgi:hypothetical protein